MTEPDGKHPRAHRYVILNAAQRSEESDTAAPPKKKMRFLAPLGMTWVALGMTMDALLMGV